MCTYTLQYPSNIEISNAVLTIQAPSVELEEYIMILNDSRINTYIWERNTMCVIFRLVPSTLCPYVNILLNMSETYLYWYSYNEHVKFLIVIVHKYS